MNTNYIFLNCIQFLGGNLGSPLPLLLSGIRGSKFPLKIESCFDNYDLCINR